MQDLVLYYPDHHEKHAYPGHPERPERVEAIRQALQDAGLWFEDALLQPVEPPLDVLHAIHTPAHLQKLQTASESGRQIDPDTYLTPSSWQLAMNTVGGGIAVADAVWNGQARRGFALSRPPGHHATADEAMGFCLVNNIALAAEYLIRKCGAKRLAIVDIDLHHGNGTQDIFYARKDVFFCSIHQYPLYPMSGLAKDSGVGAGEMATLNIPFPPYAGDTAREAAFEEAILPLFDSYQPEMILVSAGFDSHWRDPLGHQLVSAKGYGQMAASLAKWADRNCQGRVAVFLEGGYDLQGGAVSAVAVTQALVGERWDDPLGPATMPEDPYWKSRLKQVSDHWGL